MSLPGLELTESSTESQYVPPPPTQISLRPGSEWRFEIAFGATVRVKVCPTEFLLHARGGATWKKWIFGANNGLTRVFSCED